MHTGRVKWFDDQKGWGFIAQEGEAPDVFVHYSVIEVEGHKTLFEGQEVTYEASDDGRGPRATLVQPVPEA
ncbi:MAG TPA: cold-shock protein [Armatimonadetes bacterium]|nr:cold-shock protein [Armatimonadota bacterium]